MKTADFPHRVLTIGFCLASVFGSTGLAGQLPNPTITASARAYNAGFGAANLFDSGNAEYATLGQLSVSTPFTTSPTDGTWVEMDFGATVTFDQFLLVARPNAVDQVVESRLILSDDPVFSEADTVFTFNPSGINGSGLVRRVGRVSGRYARWEVAKHGAGSLNLGAHQMWFLDTPAGHTALPAPKVIDSYAPYDGIYAAAFAVDGNAGSGLAMEYASLGAGAGMYIDFDFGAPVPIAGFDFWNRWADLVTTYDLVFADSADFGSPVSTLSFTASPNGNQVNSETFPAVTARYVRLRATGYANSRNTGVREIQFYTLAGQAPRITQEPQGATRLLGDAFTCSVTAGGDAPVFWQWWKDSTPIENATNFSLSLSNVQPTDAASYTVVVTNAYGSITSAPAILQVINPAVEIFSDLDLWLKLDETCGPVAIDDSYNQDGTLSGFAFDDSQWVVGILGGGLRFDPNGDYTNTVVTVADFGQLDFASDPEFTLAAWVKGSAIQEDGAGLIAKGTGGGGEAYTLDVYGGVFRFFARPAVGAEVAIVTAPFGPNGTWQHVAAVYSRGLNRMKLYVNGLEMGSGTPMADNLRAAAHDVSVGARQFSTNLYDLNFRGVMDDVRIYARALTPGDVQELVKQAPPQPPGIGTPPQGGVVLDGNPWAFSVFAYGEPPLSYQWLKNGRAIERATDTNYLLASAQVSDGGDYSVVVSNINGIVESAVARLDVISLLDLRSAPVQASSQWSNEFPPSHAFDGLRFSTGPDTARWASAGQGTPQWIYVDLGQDLRIRYVLVDWEYAAGRNVRLCVRSDAEGVAADPAEWHEVSSITGYAQNGNGVDGADVVFDLLHHEVALPGNVNSAVLSTISSDTIIGRYLMVHVLALTSPHSHTSIWEVQVDAVAVPPTLTITRTGDEVEISWPAEYSGFELESTDLLPASVWTPVPGVVSNRVVVGSGEGNRFFRLRRP